MLRGAVRAFPLLNNHQSVRRMATLNGIKVGLNNARRSLISDANLAVATNAMLKELRPPTPAELPRAIKDLIRLFTQRNWQNVTVREAWLNTLVTTEVICWFFVGECIGKGNLIGYQV